MEYYCGSWNSNNNKKGYNMWVVSFLNRLFGFDIE